MALEADLERLQKTCFVEMPDPSMSATFEPYLAKALSEVRAAAHKMR